MIKTLQRRFALSRQGAVDLIKGCIACVLQVAQDLFVDVAKQMTFLAAAEVDFVELVDHLTQQRAVFHVVVGVTECLFHYKAARVGIHRRGHVF